MVRDENRGREVCSGIFFVHVMSVVVSEVRLIFACAKGVKRRLVGNVLLAYDVCPCLPRIGCSCVRNGGEEKSLKEYSCGMWF